MDAETLNKKAQAAKEGCPVSQAPSAVEINWNSKDKGGDDTTSGQVIFEALPDEKTNVKEEGAGRLDQHPR